MKIVIISPKGPLYRHRGGIFGRALRYKPLTLTSLAALVPAELNAEIVLFDEGVQNVPLDLEADLVGITLITGNAPRAYEMAGHFRRRGIPVVLGGPHVTLIPDDAQPHADAIVVGYAEDTWPQLLRDFTAGKLQRRYVQAPELSLANRPFPRRELLPRRRYLTDAVFEAQRGCLHDCEFCVVPAAWGRKLWQKPVADVVADIRQHAARRILFVDLNLYADRAYAQELFTALVPLHVEWHGLVTTMFADDTPTLELAARSGCRGVLMGLESISEESLRDCRKGFNSPEEYRQMVERLHAHRIALNGCFVFGADHDTPDVFLKTAEFAIETRIDLPRFAIATPFPNTALYRRLDGAGRILTRNWELYDAQHAVFRPARMTPQELERGHELAWKHTYRYSAMARRLRGSPMTTGLVWAANLTYRRYAHRLHEFYTCDWFVGREPVREAA
ncbi:MAG: cobalamin-dependent protein [Verrucomicrobiia bacterium]|jgi:radical SAM superfamily enzyme YgiQ (UPF0313 family)